MTTYSPEHDAIIRPAIWGLLHRMPAYLDVDDAMQIARMAVWRAFPSYDPAKGQLEPFISATAKLRLHDYIRDAEGRRATTQVRKGQGINVRSLDENRRNVRPYHETVADTQADDPEEVMARRVDGELAMAALRYLPERELRVVMMRAAEAEFQEIAQDLGVSTTRAQQIFYQARERILARLAA